MHLVSLYRHIWRIQKDAKKLYIKQYLDLLTYIITKLKDIATERKIDGGVKLEREHK